MRGAVVTAVVRRCRDPVVPEARLCNALTRSGMSECSHPFSPGHATYHKQFSWVGLSIWHPAQECLRKLLSRPSSCQIVGSLGEMKGSPQVHVFGGSIMHKSGLVSGNN
jgi:hypothetical protein